MQMIVHQTVNNFPDWKAAFDADAEARRDAGLTVLQIWKHADNDTDAFFLLEVNSRSRAEAWIKRIDALTGDDNGTVKTSSTHFIQTA